MALIVDHRFNKATDDLPSPLLFTIFLQKVKVAKLVNTGVENVIGWSHLSINGGVVEVIDRF